MVNTKIGSYEIIEEIGKGGLATVYRAYQPNVGRHVAIKVLRGVFEDNWETLARFQREARMVARLEHIHILPVYDFDGKHDPPYIVMRLLEGGTLKDLIQREPLTFGEVIHLTRQIASALDYAHRQGVIHRDIKPSNIMIDRDGNVFVTDFGLARLAGGVSDSGVREITQAGMVMGTPGYMAPEQGMGEAEIDHRADIYSLGVIIFQMLTGELPYSAPTAMGMLLQHFHEPIPSAVDRNPILPPSVDEFLEKAMAKDPDDRFQRAGEMIEMLSRVLGETPDTLILSVQKIRAATSTPGGDSKELGTGSRGTSREQYKLVTVLYVNFDEFAEFLDFKDERITEERLKLLWNEIDSIIDEYGGKFFQRSRHTALALWGAVTSREDDPERAIRAALAMQTALKQFLEEDEFEDDPLPMQMGINTGPVLLARSGDSGDYTVSGSTTYVVQRLERLAPIGSVLISHDTYRLVRGVFNFELCDPLRMRGRKEHIPTYLVRSAKSRAFRVNTRGVEGVETRMIGRKAELEMLQELFYTVVEDCETQVVTVVSDPGLGKSRLLYEFINWTELEETPFWVFQGRATPEITHRPYSLLRDVFTYRFEIQDSDSPTVVRQKLVEGMEQMTGVADERAAHFIGHLLGFDFSDSPQLAGILNDAQQLQKQALRYLEQFFIHITTKRNGTSAGAAPVTPAVFRLEEIHWADESSLDAIHYIISQNPNLPMLFVCLARPEFYERRPTWGSGQSSHTRIDLRPLSNRESRQLVREILQKVTNIPEELRDLLMDRAEGNPFMMEELVKVLIEDRVIVKEEPAWRVELDRLSNVRVPPTLTGLIQVQLDSLFPAERILLQRAAAVGRIFWDRALQALETADNYEIDVETSLEGLMKREFIILREDSAFSGVREFIFRNQIMRDVVYESLLVRQKQAYHARVAEWLIQISGERAVEYTASIAENYSLGGENAQAIEYLQRAGEQAQQVSAFNEALAFYQKARALLPLEKGGETMQVSLEVRIGEIMWILGNYDQARQSLLVALNLARALGNKLGQADALYQLGRIGILLSQLTEAEKFMAESLILAKEIGNLSAQARAHYGLGAVIWRQVGDYPAANDHYRACLELARQAGDTTQTINALLGLGINAMRLKDFAQAHEYFREGQTLALEVGNQERLATIYLNEGEVWRAEGNYVQARNHHNRSLSLARIIGEPSLAIIAQGNLGLTAIQAGDREEAARHFTEVMRDGVARKVMSTMLIGLIGMAWIRAVEGKHIESLSLLGLVFHHPAGQDENVRGDAEPILELLRKTHSEDEIQYGMEQGKLLHLDTIVMEFLDPKGK